MLWVLTYIGGWIGDIWQVSIGSHVDRGLQAQHLDDADYHDNTSYGLPTVKIYFTLEDNQAFWQKKNDGAGIHSVSVIWRVADMDKWVAAVRISAAVHNTSEASRRRAYSIHRCTGARRGATEGQRREC